MKKFLALTAALISFAVPTIAATLADNAGENYIERRAVDVGENTWPTAFVVHYQNERFVVMEGERGLTRDILFSSDPDVIIPWANAAFGGNFRMDGDGGGQITTIDFGVDGKLGGGDDTVTAKGNGANF